MDQNANQVPVSLGISARRSIYRGILVVREIEKKREERLFVGAEHIFIGATGEIPVHTVFQATGISVDSVRKGLIDENEDLEPFEFNPYDLTRVHIDERAVNAFLAHLKRTPTDYVIPKPVNYMTRVIRECILKARTDGKQVIEAHDLLYGCLQQQNNNFYKVVTKELTKVGKELKDLQKELNDPEGARFKNEALEQVNRILGLSKEY